MATFRRLPISWEGLRWLRSKVNNSAAESELCHQLSSDANQYWYR